MFDMEAKLPWNMRVYRSISKRFDELVEAEVRGDKGAAVCAALLLWELSTASERKLMVDVLHLAEGRGADGTILDAAKGVTEDRRPGSLAFALAASVLAHDLGHATLHGIVIDPPAGTGEAGSGGVGRVEGYPAPSAPESPEDSGESNLHESRQNTKNVKRSAKKM